jgi:hypothetical protein
MIDLLASYERIPSDTLGRRRYLIDYVRSDGGFGGFECITIAHRQSWFEVVYRAAELRAASHGFKLQSVSRKGR